MNPFKVYVKLVHYMAFIKSHIKLPLHIHFLRKVVHRFSQKVKKH